MSNIYNGSAIDASFQATLIFPSGSREEDFLEINQSEIKIVCCGHVCNRIGTNLAIVIGNFPYIHPTKFRFIWQNGFRGEVFRY
jgi:hypothetical protein